MKHSLNRFSKLLSIAVLFATLSVIVTSLPSAFATPDPGQGAFPNQIVQNGVTTLKIGTGSHQVFTAVNQIAVYTDETQLGCPLPAPSGGEKRYNLLDSLNSPVTATLTTITSSIEMPWGTGATFAITQSGAGTVSGTGPYHWADSAGAPGTPADSTAVLDLLVFRTCGTEGGTSPGLAYSGDGLFEIVPPVAGELLPIDMTAVLVAGAFTNQMMLLPILGLVAASAFVILKIQVRRN